MPRGAVSEAQPWLLQARGALRKLGGEAPETSSRQPLPSGSTGPHTVGL